MSNFGRSDLGLLRTFEAVVSRRSFSRAAEHLGMAQSTVSAQIKQIEEKIGRVLIERTTRGFKLTSSGETMLFYAQSILGLSDQIEQHFGGPKSGPMPRFGLVADLATVRLAELLTIFHLSYPDLAVFVTTDRTTRLLEMLNDRDLDVVIGKQRVGERLGRKLWDNEAMWIGRGELVTDRDRAVPIVLGRMGTMSRTLALDALHRAGLRWQVRFEGETMIGLVAAVEAGLGVTVGGSEYLPLPDRVIRHHPILPALDRFEYFIATAPNLNAPSRTFGLFIEDAITRLHGDLVRAQPT